MSGKSFTMLGMVIGSSIGGYVPVMMGVSIFSAWSIVGSVIGGIIGVYVGYKFGDYMDI